MENSPPAAELKIGFNGRRLPITPAEAVKYYGNRLTDYEKTEIEKYPEIWYMGLDACKIHGEDFDDDNGSYNKVGCLKKIFRVFFELICRFCMTTYRIDMKSSK